MLKNSGIVLILALLLMQVFSGCNSIKTSEGLQTSISDKIFNDKDSEAIADSLVAKLVSNKIIGNFSSKRKPRIVVGSIKDLTPDSINTELLAKNIERSFLNTGSVTFISSKSKREKVRYNRKNRNDFKSEKELKKYLEPLKSDFFISGEISVNIDSVASIKKYKLELEVFKSKNAKLLFTDSVTVNK